MSIRPMSRRAIQLAAAAEFLWAIFLAYEIHHRSGSGFGLSGWQLQLLNFFQEWADTAVAIVVVAWVVDMAVAQFADR
jgi:hypothetical protein